MNMAAAIQPSTWVRLRKCTLLPPRSVTGILRFRGTTSENTANEYHIHRQEHQRVPPMENWLMYRYLRLESFSDKEFQAVFDSIHNSQSIHTIPQEPEKKTAPCLPILTEDRVSNYLLERIREIEIQQQQSTSSGHVPDTSKEIEQQRRQYAASQAKQFLQAFQLDANPRTDQPTTEKTITKSLFCELLRSKAGSVDYKKTFPITTSMLMVGTSVGVISPVMPFVVQEMGLSAGQFGMVVSAFALAKMAGNVPSAVLVERHGRKPYMVYSLSLIAAGTAGVGFANSFELLYLSRLLVGFGVAALSSASTLSIADMSTPLNRAQTMAPIMSAFAAGTALGPAMGGFLADKVGVHPTFYIVGASFLTMTLVNQMLLTETQPKPLVFPWQEGQEASKASAHEESVWQATKDAIGQWAPLMSNPKISTVVVINGFYWVALAGAQMTLLPLMLTNPNGLAMTATGVGQVYMGMSLVQVLGNPLVAKLVDRFGKVPAILAGCSLISGSIAALPLSQDMLSLAATLGIWATGSTFLSTAPVAYISDVADDEKRAQAIALLRTSGDVGFLVGASAVGAVADWTGNIDLAMQASAGVLLTATAWFGMRKYLAQKIELQK